jgi:hypothetical protein
VVAVHGAYGTRRIDDLRGWAVRAPLLGVGLVIVAVAAVGWPASLAWESRARLIELTLAQPINVLVLIGAVIPVAIYVRLLVIGLGRPTDIVAGGLSERPTWSAPLPSRPMLGRGGLERAFERTNHAMNGLIDILWTVPSGLRANRALIAAVLVLSLAGLSVAVSAGGLGVPAAAAAIPAQNGETPTGSDTPGETEPAGSAEPSEPEPSKREPSSSPEAVPGSTAPSGTTAPSASRLPAASGSSGASLPPGPPSFEPLPTF